MFRRMRRGRSTRPARKSVQHFTCSLANVIVTTGALVLNCANAGAMSLTEASNVVPIYATSNKQQEVTVGSQIGRTTFDIGIRGATTSGILEYMVFKVERANTIPALGAGGLPTAAQILAGGMQCTMREFQPGRCLEFGLLAYTADTTRTKKIVTNWKKFKMATLRQGDFYGIIYFNRGGGSVTVDSYCRFKEWI